MQDLRLVGVHDGGEHLLLSGTDGEIFRLRIDEALRVAASRSPHRQGHSPSASAASGEPAAELSPRDIQTRIRAGATAEQVAEESGIDLARIQRYEGPVRAERDYIAGQAQAIEVATALPHHDGYRSAFGDKPANLAQMVAHRVAAYGVNPESVQWDAWRRPDGAWNVVARFDADSEAAADIDEPPPAQWTFHAGRKSLHNANRWAQVLSELEPLDGALPARRLTAVADRVFDIEAESDSGHDDDDPHDSSGLDPDNLLEVLRSRRGQRIGEDEEGDDALALMLHHGGVPAAHPRNEHPERADSSHGEEEEDERSLFPALTLAPDYRDDDGDLHHLHEGVSSRTREIVISGAPRAADDGKTDDGDGTATASQSETRNGADTDDSGGGAAPAGVDSAEAGRSSRQPAEAQDGEGSDRKHIKPKRSSVPSWDEIVFGTKSE